MHTSATHLVLIPSYNTGAKLVETVRAARARWSPVWVVIDGSTDGSDAPVAALAADDPGLRVLRLERNGGKGAAVLHGLRAAAAAGFTHALTMDADGQHPAERIADLMAASRAAPDAMILGQPVFDASAPRARVHGRRISNFFADLATLWAGIGDSLFGFRLYPIVPLLRVMERGRWMRGFDFDPEAAVRLAWTGVRPVRIATAVRYFRPEEGGVSHFDYLRDNALLVWMHSRLLVGALARLPQLAARRLRARPRL
ncbi:MAG: glycosyltransferase family 2 protein [Burkholderiales bacterium]|nr:glycosyltransferase family 2 protein [Burkholderiales bacterium]